MQARAFPSLSVNRKLRGWSLEAASLGWLRLEGREKWLVVYGLFRRPVETTVDVGIARALSVDQTGIETVAI
jgi:hypothetical protein